MLTLGIVRVARPGGHRQGTEAFAYPGHLFARSMVDRCFCLHATEFTPGATTSPSVREIFSSRCRAYPSHSPALFTMPPVPLRDRGLPPPRGVQGPTRPRPSTLNGRGNGVPYAFSPGEHGRLNPAFERMFGAMASPVAFNPKSFTHAPLPPGGRLQRW